MEILKRIITPIVASLITVGALIYFYFNPNSPQVVLAMLGTFSWLFIFIKSIIDATQKTTVIIVNDSSFTIGYGQNGGYLITHLALIGKGGDSLVEKISITITHVENETRQFFEWQQFHESMYNMTVPEGDIPFNRSQKAMAINVEEDYVFQQNILFFNKNITQKYNLYQEDVNEKRMKLMEQSLININSTTPSEYNPTHLIASEEYKKLSKFFEEEFYWKRGQHEVLIEIKIYDKETTIKKKVFFDISDRNLESLQTSKLSHKEYLNSKYKDNSQVNFSSKPVIVDVEDVIDSKSKK